MAEKKNNWTAFSVKCCNPYKETFHSKSGKLRNVTPWMCNFGFEIQIGMKICDGCRIKISKHSKNESLESKHCVVEESEPSTSASEQFTDPDTSLDYLNKSLELIGESPIKKKRLVGNTYSEKKFAKIKTTLQESLAPKAGSKFQKSLASSEEETEILKQLKEKFSQTNKKSEKMMMLTILPFSWSQKKIQDEFGVSDYMARRIKKLVGEKGILSTPNPKPGKTLDASTANSIKNFYNSDEVSRIMPGKKDYVTIISEDGTKINVQKRLVLANLKEIYQLYKSKHLTQNVGLSKFCEMRPKNCILAGKSGTHTVCVCLYHQNVKLMLNGSGINKFVLEGDETSLNDYKSCLAKIMCPLPSTECHMNECEKCPGIINFQNQLRQKFEDEIIDSVTYKKWIATDQCTMETVIKNTEAFIEEFTTNLLKLKTHSFISKKQKEFYSHMKENLGNGEMLITCDFSENYSFVMQDEVQSYHWTNIQATLHPFVVYFNTNCNTVEHKNYVFISESLKHNTIAFNLFQTKLIEVLKENFKISKIYYFSDGSAAQYKNRKNFLNICMHKSDFGIDAEWHFFATSHGKSACDGLGGTVKRIATKASLQRPNENHIITPKQLYEYAKTNIPGINFMYCTHEDYLQNEKRLYLRFDDSLAVPGTQKIHAIIPLSQSQMVTKPYSFSFNEYTESPAPSKSFLEVYGHWSGFVTVNYEKSWWLACILDKNEEYSNYKVSFLHPKGPSASFCFPKPRSDILDISVNDILRKVDPCTATGRTYTLTKEEMMTSSAILEKKTLKS